MMAQPPVLPTMTFPQTEDALFYILYFQSPGIAEQELERDISQTLRKIFFALSGDDTANTFNMMVPRGDGLLEHKGIVAGRLAESKVTVRTAHHRHQGEKSHAERFSIYSELIKTCVRSALETHKELIVGVAKQGGWQQYEQEFCASLRLLPEEFTKHGNHRKADFDLLSATKPGIQLADFYVGAVREFTIDESVTVPFDLISEQVITRQFHVQEVAKSEK
jgi:hypothetical protein